MDVRGFIAAVLISAALPAGAADKGGDRPMPVPECAPGWRMDGAAAVFDKDTLFDRINGESELYFPYGFESLVYARYESGQNPLIAIDADVYAMGSLLDAFGMFSNYRKKNDADVTTGAGGAVSDSQLFFYQDRYFVRLQVTGAVSIAREPIIACAQAIAKRLPPNASRPRELDALAVPGVVAKSERYVAQRLLGYEFFRRGLIAETTMNKGQAQVFIAFEQSQEAARRALERYRAYLFSSGGSAKPAGDSRNSYKGSDPLYGMVIVRQHGDCIIGLVKASDAAEAMSLIDRVASRMRP